MSAYSNKFMMYTNYTLIGPMKTFSVQMDFDFKKCWIFKSSSTIKQVDWFTTLGPGLDAYIYQFKSSEWIITCPESVL